MPVHQILEMPYEEFIGWTKYFNQRPYGWREDNRTALLLSAQGVKEKAHKIFPSLAALRRNNNRSSEVIPPQLLKMLRSAKQGDEWNPTFEEAKEEDG